MVASLGQGRNKLRRVRLTSTRSGLTRRSVGVYSTPSQTFTSNRLGCPSNQPDGVHYECLYRRHAGELLVIQNKELSMSFIRQLKLLLGLAFLFVANPGCSNDQASPKQNQSSPKQLDFPEDWDQIGISEAKNGDITSYVLTGKNQSLEAAIKVLKSRIAKPIKCADDVDASKKLPKIRIEVKNGTAVELLTKIAETFDCILEETSDTFILKKQP